jgi:acyl carrier protein
MKYVYREHVVQYICLALDRANELLEPVQRLARSEETVLFGPGGGLDSLGLVSLILDVEASVNDHAGVSLVLSDDRAMSQRRSPFRDVRSLADYVMSRLAEVEP